MNAKELMAYLDEQHGEHGYKIVVDVVNVNLPSMTRTGGFDAHPYVFQKPRIIPRRIILRSIWHNDMNKAYHCQAVTYNAFAHLDFYVPPDFEFELVDEETNATILEEYNTHINGLEKTFQAAYDEVHGKMNEKIDGITKLLSEMRDLADESGVPFQIVVGEEQFRIEYRPKKMEKFKIDNHSVANLVDDLTGISGYPYPGWVHSSIC